MERLDMLLPRSKDQTNCFSSLLTTEGMVRQAAKVWQKSSDPV